MQDTQAQQTIQQGIVMLTAWIVAELDSTDFGFHAALSSSLWWVGWVYRRSGRLTLAFNGAARQWS
ncbi:hypothetical protein PPUN109347_51270 [Pseudomonas putida]|nr:hypothetical protein PPUN109347_51270 [Pseudomonas putida]